MHSHEIYNYIKPRCNADSSAQALLTHMGRSGTPLKVFTQRGPEVNELIFQSPKEYWGLRFNILLTIQRGEWFGSKSNQGNQ